VGFPPAAKRRAPAIAGDQQPAVGLGVEGEDRGIGEPHRAPSPEARIRAPIAAEPDDGGPGARGRLSPGKGRDVEHDHRGAVVRPWPQPQEPFAGDPRNVLQLDDAPLAEARIEPPVVFEAGDGHLFDEGSRRPLPGFGHEDDDAAGGEDPAGGKRHYRFDLEAGVLARLSFPPRPDAEAGIGGPIGVQPFETFAKSPQDLAVDVDRFGLQRELDCRHARVQSPGAGVAAQHRVPLQGVAPGREQAAIGLSLELGEGGSKVGGPKLPLHRPVRAERGIGPDLDAGMGGRRHRGGQKEGKEQEPAHGASCTCNTASRGSMPLRPERRTRGRDRRRGRGARRR